MIGISLSILVKQSGFENVIYICMVIFDILRLTKRQAYGPKFRWPILSGGVAFFIQAGLHRLEQGRI